MSLAAQRLAEERKNWRRDKPFGFVAKPKTKDDGSVDLHTWYCIIPGKEGTYMEAGKFPVTLRFPQEYPSVPPAANFPKGFLHVNVFENGGVCLSILKTEMPEHLVEIAKKVNATVDAWKPSITIKQILLSIQELLHSPNFGSVANWAAYNLMKSKGLAGYERKMREQAEQYSRTGDDE